MKKVILALAIVSVSFAACNNGETAVETPVVDSVAAPVVDSVVAPIADSVVAPVEAPAAH